MKLSKQKFFGRKKRNKVGHKDVAHTLYIPTARRLIEITSGLLKSDFSDRVAVKWEKIKILRPICSEKNEKYDAA